VAARPLVAGLAVLAALVLSVVPASGLGPLYGSLAGPDAIAPGQAGVYNLTIFGGPDGAVRYTVQWHITGSNAAGGLPTAANPTTATDNRTTFRLNVTAPQAEQTITLFVKISASVGSTVENTTVQKSIVVVTPVVLSATFTNQGTTAAVNVTVRFYVDGALVGTETIARINPSGSATATFNYLPANLQSGTHQVRIEADLAIEHGLDRVDRDCGVRPRPDRHDRASPAPTDLITPARATRRRSGSASASRAASG